MLKNTQNPKKVLIVDDEPDIIEIFAHLVHKIGLEVQTASSVNEALPILANWSPDIIISDYHMPDKNGGDLLAIVREGFSHLNLTKFLFITGDSSDIESDSRCEGINILKKPVRFSFLKDALLSLAYPCQENSHELLPIEATGT